MEHESILQRRRTRSPLGLSTPASSFPPNKVASRRDALAPLAPVGALKCVLGAAKRERKADETEKSSACTDALLAPLQKRTLARIMRGSQMWANTSPRLAHLQSAPSLRTGRLTSCDQPSQKAGIQYPACRGLSDSDCGGSTGPSPLCSTERMLSAPSGPVDLSAGWPHRPIAPFIRGCCGGECEVEVHGATDETATADLHGWPRHQVNSLWGSDSQKRPDSRRPSTCFVDAGFECPSRTRSLWSFSHLPSEVCAVSAEDDESEAVEPWRAMAITRAGSDIVSDLHRGASRRGARPCREQMRSRPVSSCSSAAFDGGGGSYQ